MIRTYLVFFIYGRGTMYHVLSEIFAISQRLYVQDIFSNRQFRCIYCYLIIERLLSLHLLHWLRSDFDHRVCQITARKNLPNLSLDFPHSSNTCRNINHYNHG